MGVAGGERWMFCLVTYVCFAKEKRRDTLSLLQKIEPKNAQSPKCKGSTSSANMAKKKEKTNKFFCFF